jgi:hypothetical protein
MHFQQFQVPPTRETEGELSQKPEKGQGIGNTAQKTLILD